mmetsp:Transcript_35323/g.34352  ORF Transcript_35323/g.34352 Transcript_35323/m.34352 type:complete len:191 (+) Transcript_35323:328-900(+)
MFFFFEVPFDFIITAAIVQFFLWLKFAAWLYSKDMNDIEEIEEDHNKYRVFMLSAVNFSMLALIVRLISIIIPTMNTDLAPTYVTGFETAMNLILIVLYSVVTFAFIPLFSVIMYKLKKDYIPVYTKIACKMLVFFIIFMLFLLLRLFIYIDMSFNSSEFNGLQDVELNQEIPFFLSEVIITFAFSYMLF